MATRKAAKTSSGTTKPGALAATGIKELPELTVVEKWPIGGYAYRYTTGPFLLPQNSGSLDWALLNNDSSRQQARVTVYQCPIGAVKAPVPPGALVVTVDPGRATHNANTYPEGFIYEIQVECNSQLLFPYVSVWPGNMGYAIPGTGIPAGSFLRLMP